MDNKELDKFIYYLTNCVEGDIDGQEEFKISANELYTLVKEYTKMLNKI